MIFIPWNDMDQNLKGEKRRMCMDGGEEIREESREA
jgi:hypothetical protein